MFRRKTLGLAICTCVIVGLCVYEYGPVIPDKPEDDGKTLKTRRKPVENTVKLDSSSHSEKGFVTRRVVHAKTRKTIRDPTHDKLHISSILSSKQTYYRWNDLKSMSRQKLPIKKHKDGTLAPSGLTEKEANKAVIYTRLPKTGSRFMLIALLRKSATANNFNMIYSTVYNHSGFFHKQAKFARDVGRFETPFLMARQLYFLDFTEFNMAQPIYISIIRDPVERVVSSFNFNRFGDGTANAWYKMYKAERNLTLDNCIFWNKKECSVEDASVTIRYFCGQDPQCKIPSNWSLERAKANVERHYLLVGLLEEYENTLKLLERLLPSFFEGVSDLYKGERSKAATASKKHFVASPTAKEILRARFHIEYEFYNFVRSRFERLMEKLES